MKKRPPMPRPPATCPNIQLDMFNPVRHIEHVIERTYWELTPNLRKKLGEKLYEAREIVRQAGDML